MFIERDIIPNLKNKLEKEEILLIIGPRQSGKTTVMRNLANSLKQHGKTSFFLNLEDKEYLNWLNQSPKNLFNIFPIDIKRKTYIFIDEIQYLQDPSNFLKYFFDEYKDKIKIIASGSSAFYLDEKFKDSLVGRKIIFNLLTLTFMEFVRFKNSEIIQDADFKNLTISQREKILPLYMEYMTYGGYPKVVLSEEEEKKDVLADIAYSYIKKDVFESNIRNDEYFYMLFKLLASQTGSLVNSSELANTLDISKTAIDKYLSVMQKSFHIVLIKPFYKNIRKELTKMPKVYFIDPGLRNFFKRDFRGFYERDDNGQILENACFRHLIDKYDKDDIKFWRTADQKEVDFIISEKTALEIKCHTKNIKSTNYKSFMDTYPDIEFHLVSLDKKNNKFSILYPWELI